LPRTALLLLLGTLAALWAPRQAEAAGGAIRFTVTVLEVSGNPGKVDPRAARLHALLKAKIRYESLKVLAVTRVSLKVDDIGQVRLPTGKSFRFRPIDAGPSGVLVAVDMQGTAQGDFRIPRGKPLILGGPSYKEGQLVVVLEAPA